MGKPPTARPATRPDRSAFGPLLVWLVIELVALLIPAAGWRYAATERFPNPPEQLAAQVMVIVQLAASSLLFPYLLRNWTTALMVILASVPMTVLSGFLAGHIYYAPIAKVSAYLSGWLLALAILRTALRSRAMEMVAVAILAVWVIGAGVLSYLHAEFGVNAASRWPIRLWDRSPITEVLFITQFKAERWELPWMLAMLLGAASAISAVGWLLRRHRTSVDKSQSAYPQ